MSSQKHAVRIYRDPAELGRQVAAFLAPGIEAGRPSLVVARPGHAELIAAELRARGADPGLVRFEDAYTMLDLILVDGHPSAAAFEHVVGGALDDLAERSAGAEVLVFGEMVDILAERGAHAEAVSLEELWNSLAWSRDFSLLCGYRIDVFDLESQVAHLPEICRTHSHVAPAADMPRFSGAVDDALAEVLGESEAGKVYVLVGNEIREARVPAAQLVLMWVCANMPFVAGRVLAAARRRYAAAVAVS
jgi:MEDS: MEthanogen/methylotroph, DcmR Sensory domain